MNQIGPECVESETEWILFQLDCIGLDRLKSIELEGRATQRSRRTAMASGVAVLAVIRAARPVFRSAYDRVAFAVHASLLAGGYSLTAVGSAATSSVPSGSLPSGSLFSPLSNFQMPAGVHIAVIYPQPASLLQIGGTLKRVLGEICDTKSNFRFKAIRERREEFEGRYVIQSLVLFSRQRGVKGKGLRGDM